MTRNRTPISRILGKNCEIKIYLSLSYALIICIFLLLVIIFKRKIATLNARHFRLTTCLLAASLTINCDPVGKLTRRNVIFKRWILILGSIFLRWELTTCVVEFIPWEIYNIIFPPARWKSNLLNFPGQIELNVRSWRLYVQVSISTI